MRPRATWCYRSIVKLREKEWKKAMDTEMESTKENDIWDLVKLPERIKDSPDGCNGCIS